MSFVLQRVGCVCIVQDMHLFDSNKIHLLGNYTLLCYIRLPPAFNEHTN